MSSITTYFTADDVNPRFFIVKLFVVVFPLPVTLKVAPPPFPENTSMTLSPSDALPLLKVTAPKVELVTISGVVELSYVF